MRILITGGTGYLGQAVEQALHRHHHDVTLLARRCPAAAGVEGCVAGDISTADLSRLFQGFDGVVHLVGIIQEHPSQGITFDKIHRQATKRVVDAIARAGVPRLVHMSALGTREGAASQYHLTKWQAEQYVRASSSQWTILRPSLLFGGGSPFFATLESQVRWPLVPVPGSGKTLFQPVARDDVAELVAQLVEGSQAAGQTWEVGGPDRYSLNALYRRVGLAVGRDNLSLAHIPLGALMLAARLGQNVPGFPVSVDQLLMLNEPNITSDERWRQLVPEARKMGTDL